MQVELNSVWRVHNLDGLEDGLYRVLQLYIKEHIVILFPLLESKALQRPLKLDFDFFNEAIKTGNSELSSYELPYYQLQSEDDISESYLEKEMKNIDLSLN
ncbi:hypothetical protein [Enterobacter hormaechei]